MTANGFHSVAQHTAWRKAASGCLEHPVCCRVDESSLPAVNTSCEGSRFSSSCEPCSAEGLPGWTEVRGSFRVTPRTAFRCGPGLPSRCTVRGFRVCLPSEHCPVQAWRCKYDSRNFQTQAKFVGASVCAVGPESFASGQPLTAH